MSRQLSAQAPAPKPSIDIRRALKQRIQGVSYKDIAISHGVSTQAAQQALKPLMELIGDPEELQAYQHNKADILEGVQKQLARSLLDPEKVAKANLGNVAYAMRQLNDMLRLERDQSTSNVAVAHVEAIKTMEEVDAEIAKITEELPDDPTKEEKFASRLEDGRVKKLEAEIARITGQDIDSIDDVIDVEPGADG